MYNISKTGNIYIRKSLYYLFFLFVQLEFITPDYLGYTSFFRIIRILQHPLTILAFAIYIIYFLRNKFINGIATFVFLFMGITVLKNGNVSIAFMNFERCFSIIIYYSFLYKIDRKLFCKCISDYWLILMVLNTALTVIKPDGLLQLKSDFADIDKEYYLLGVSNQVMPFYYIGITFNYIFCRNNYGSNRRIVFLFGCMWISELIYMSMTSLMGCLMFTLGVFCFAVNIKSKLMTKKRQKKWRNLIVSSIFLISLIYYLVVFIRIQEKFAKIIEVILHKDATLSTRTIIWDEAFNMISNSLLLGYGAADNNNRYIRFGTYSFNAHNLFLQLFLMGGIVLFACFVYIFVISIVSLNKCNDSKLKGFILTLTITFLFTSLSEVYTMSLVFIVFFIVYISQDAIKTSVKDVLKLSDCKIAMQIKKE